MRQFAYQAINGNGSMVTGTLEAETLDMAKHLLAERGLIPSSVNLKGKAEKEGFGRSWKERLNPVKNEDLILFTKQFRTMLRAGVAILPLLRVLEKQTEKPRMKRMIAEVTDAITGGSTLQRALLKHPDIFSPLYCSMVRAGEISGTLPEVLDRLVSIIEHEHKVKSDIKSALRYPVIVLGFLGVAFFVLLTFVMPNFVHIFKSAGLDLPPPTLICMAVYTIIGEYWYMALGITGAGILALRLYLKTAQGQLTKDTLMLRIPIIGSLQIKAAMSRFASIFALLQSSGVTVLEALDILSGAIGNTAIAKEFDRVRGMLEDGRGISRPLRAAKFFTPMVVNMVAIGEESGNLDEMLREVSSHYDDEVDYAVGRLSEAIGPVLIVGLAGVVGFFALAIFLPMWDLTKMVK